MREKSDICGYYSRASVIGTGTLSHLHNLLLRWYLLDIEAQHDGRTPHRNEEDAIELKTILLQAQQAGPYKKV